jgi:hypothetical protein
VHIILQEGEDTLQAGDAEVVGFAALRKGEELSKQMVEVINVEECMAQLGTGLLQCLRLERGQRVRVRVQGEGDIVELPLIRRWQGVDFNHNVRDLVALILLDPDGHLARSNQVRDREGTES